MRLVLPYHLRNLAQVGPEIELAGSTVGEVLDALERAHPVLRGTVRDASTGTRRPFVRFFACSTDLSQASPDDPLPDAVLSGAEPLLIVGAMAGG